MDLTEDILNTIVNDYDNISSLPVDQILEKSIKIRQSILQVINQHLLDVSKISKEIKKAKGETSQTQTILSFMDHLVTHFPHHVFVPTEFLYSQLSEDRKNKCTSQYREFLFNFLSSLLQLLGTKEINRIFADVNILIYHLLDLIKLKNIGLYKFLLENLVELCERMEEKKLFMLSSEIEINEKEQDRKVASQNNFNLSIPSFVYLETVQIEISKILSKIVGDICQFVPDKVETFWMLILSQIETGVLELKSSSLEIQIFLLEKYGLPHDRVSDDLSLCVMGLLEQFENSLRGKNELMEYFSESEMSLYFNSVRRFLEHVFVCEIALDDNISHPKYNFGITFVKELSKFLCTELCGNSHPLQSLVLVISKYVLLFVLDFKRSNSTVPSSLIKYCNQIIDIHLNYEFTTYTAISENIAYALFLCTMSNTLSSDVNMDVSQCAVEYNANEFILDKFINKGKDLITKIAGIKNGKFDIKQTEDYLRKHVAYLAMSLQSVLVGLVLIKNNNEEAYCNFFVKTIDFLHFDQTLFSILEIFLLLVKHSKNKSNSKINIIDLYGKITDYVKNCVLVNHIVEIQIGSNLAIKNRQELIEISTTVLSIPFLENYEWQDLKINSKLLKKSDLLLVCADLRNQNFNFRDDLNHSIVKNCLIGLTFLPKSCFPSWRSYLVVDWGLDINNSHFVATSLTLIPYLCFNLNLNVTLMTPILYKMLKSTNQRQKIGSFAGLEFLPTVLTGQGKITTEFMPTSEETKSGDYFYHCDLLCTKLMSQEKSIFLHEKYIHFLQDVEKFIRSSLNSSEYNCFLEDVCLTWWKCIVRSLQYIDKSSNSSIQLFGKVLSVVVKFSNIEFLSSIDVSSMIECGNNNYNGKWNTVLMKEIDNIEVAMQKKEDTKTCLQFLELMCNTLKHCQKYQNECGLINWCLGKMCRYLCMSSSRISSTIYCILETILKDVTERENIFHAHCQTICHNIITALLNESVLSRSPLSVVVDISELFNIPLKNFLENNLRYLLPTIPTLGNVNHKTLDLLLTEFSKSSGRSRVDMFMQNFKYIFCFSVISGTEFKTLFRFLEEHTRIKKESLILLNYGSLIQHLAAHVSVDHDKVCNALLVVEEIKSSINKRNLSISELLQPHFLSILTFFNGQLRLSNVGLHKKKEVFHSLICLMKLVDQTNLTAVSVKVVNTLCIFQQVFAKSEHSLLCCMAWDTLIHCVEKIALGGLLSQVAVMLLPFFDQYPEQVTSALEFLVVENFEYTKDNLCELYFIPDHHLLTKVKTRVEGMLSRMSQQNFLETLKQVNKQISHESAEVRVYALQRLKDVLRTNQQDLQRKNCANGESITITRNLVSMLLTCCRDTNEQVRLLSVKCLGEIGAINPDRLLFVTDAENKTKKTFLTLESIDFPFELINCLVQSFLAAKPFHQDISAYAIQELLKIYDCSEESKQISGRRLWRRFPEHIQSVLEPHLSSRYMLKKVVINLNTLKRPLIHRKQNLTFREWLGTFCTVLMDMTCTSVDDSSNISKVFQACSAVVRNNVNVAMFLLPYAFVEVLQCSDESINFAVEEVMAILKSTESIKSATKSTKPMTDSNSMCNEQLSISLNGGSHLFQLSAQVVFTILDHITQWHRQTVSTTNGSMTKARQNKEKETAIKFLARIPQKEIAEAALRCKAHYRALLHFETYLRELCDGVCDDAAVTFLQRIFTEIDETDGVAGMVAVGGTEPSPQTQLKLLESVGALQDAAACYERIIRADPSDLQHQKGFVKCLIDLGQLSTAIKVIDGTVNNNAFWKDELEPFAIEACWRLGKWDQLEEKVSKYEDTKNWSTGVGQLLLALHGKQWNKFNCVLDNLYQNQTGPLSAASMENGSYQRGYEYILRLHMLCDIEETANKVKLGLGSNEEEGDNVTCLWKQRLQVVSKSFKTNEPLVSLQRVMLPLVTGVSETCEKQLGKLWLQSSKLARKSGHISTAYGALLSAQAYNLPEYCIEHAKLLWQKGESHQALLTLQKGVKEYFSGSTPRDPQQQKTRAKVMLLVAKLMEESSSFDSNTVLRQYKDVVAFISEWEDSHFYCAKYYDKLMITLLGENRGLGKSHHLYYIMHHYGRSLCYGTSHIYESLTKLLTVWLDYGANAAKLEKMGKPQTREDVQRLLDVMVDLRSRLPAYIFYVAFSQLISRICHQHNPTYHELKQILVEVTKCFPQRALWSMMAISKSSLPQRATRCQEIFQDVSRKDKTLMKYVADAIKLTNKLLELCNKPVTNIQPLSINTHFKGLKKLVEDDRFSEILLPLQKFMTVTLPQTKKATFGSQTAYNPFPDSTVYITGFDDAIDILPSLQRPKKISIKASDGTSKIFLCKPKDDLRKDARLTEFAAIVNKCLKADTESRRRQLQIRTYAVVPLNEECGLIEWVNNMAGLRQILLPIYKQMGIYVTGKQLKACQLPVTAPLEKKLEMFRNKLLPRHPPVFHKWFLTTFPDPSMWYNARLAYARSVAVMSMVGYILGLGDRHGENILFDSNSGEAMHVDFNCLFNKGLTLEVPEIVPFRLTHNMVDAMGPTKCEGFFRRACEVTMNVLREQREPLMSVLKTFIYDPLVEWSKRGRSNSAQGESTGEVVNEKALSHVNDIDRRLRGIVAKNKGLPLSIEGHVHYLIREAKDEEKLCQMYIGWAPFM